MRPSGRVVVAWGSAVVLVQVFFFAVALLSGSFDYLGGADLHALKVATSTYQADIARLLAQVFVIDVAVLGALALPLLAWLPRWDADTRRVRWAKLLFGVVALRFAWIALAVVRIPSLFSDTYWGDGSLLTAHPMAALCSVPGVVALVLAGAAGMFLFARATSGGTRALGLLWWALVPTALLAPSLQAVRVPLPPRSVVLLVADSLRSDFVERGDLPRLAALRASEKATLLPSVVPPLPRTAPAITSLLTGKLPEETGVTTMFSPRATFAQKPSLATYFGDAGYCTVLVGEYPAEFMRKVDFGFAHVDAPIARFREITLQISLSRDPFALASLSWQPIRDRAPSELRTLLEGNPAFADPRAVMVRLANAIHDCGDRPVFAFVFGDQPHFPYVQTWPHYLTLPPYDGRYKFIKDAISTPATEADRSRIRDLYRASALSADEWLASLVSGWSKAGALDTSTVIITGDHGESLYDHLGIMGHGDQLGEMEGIRVPWLVFGKAKDAFAFPGPHVQSIHLAPRLLDAYGVKHAMKPSLDPSVVYLQTDVWFADTPNVPKDRVRYPELSDLLGVDSPDAHIELKHEYATIIEYAKHRSWLVGGDRYDVVPTADSVTVTKNGVKVPKDDLPAVVKDSLWRYDHAIARLLLR